MSESGVVYALYDPRTNEPKYVGASKQPKQRLRTHINGGSNTDVEQWVDELKENDCKPVMQIIDVAPVDELSQRERNAIERLADEWELFNNDEPRPYVHDDTKQSDQTTIPIKTKTRDRLRALKKGNETYSDVITRLIENNDN